MISNHHAKYYAYDLHRTGGEGVDRLGRALFDAAVDLNPHQIEAAMFALQSPISKGVLLADEVDRLLTALLRHIHSQLNASQSAMSAES